MVVVPLNSPAVTLRRQLQLRRHVPCTGLNGGPAPSRSPSCSRLPSGTGRRCFDRARHASVRAVEPGRWTVAFTVCDVAGLTPPPVQPLHRRADRRDRGLDRRRGSQRSGARARTSDGARDLRAAGAGPALPLGPVATPIGGTSDRCEQQSVEPCGACVLHLSRTPARSCTGGPHRTGWGPVRSPPRVGTRVRYVYDERPRLRVIDVLLKVTFASGTSSSYPWSGLRDVDGRRCRALARDPPCGLQLRA